MTTTMAPVSPTEHFATKADLAQVEGRLRTEIAQVEGRLNEKIAHLSTDLERSLRVMTWRLIGAIIVAAGVIVTILQVWPGS